MATQMSTCKILMIGIPLLMLLVVFVTFAVWVLWSLHVFIPKPPTIRTPCHSMQYEGNLREYVENRTVIDEPKQYWPGMGGGRCWSIKKRWYLPIEVPDSMEVHHSLYLVRIVSKDYEFFEEVLAMLYSPIHFFCFPIDSNSTEIFQENMRVLGECLINVIVPPGLFDVSQPSEVFRAHSACFDHMDGYQWRHLVVTQENEIPMQSIHYIADYMRRLGDSSVVGRDTVTEEQTRLLREDSKENTVHERVHIQKAACAWLGGKRDPLFLARALSDTFYDIVLNEMSDVQKEHCQNRTSPRVGRACLSGRVDENHNCIMGMEQLAHARTSRNMFVRVDPHFDFGFVQCVHELVYQRTYNTSFYKIRYGH